MAKHESSNFCQGRSLSNMSESTRPSSSKATTASTKKGGKQSSSSSSSSSASSATGGIKGDVLVQACAEIVRHLVVAAQEGRDVNLNGKQTGTTDGWMDGWMDGSNEPVVLLGFVAALKSQVSRELHLPAQPKLVDILAAIPEQHKALLVPRLKAKPIRTASGVCFFFVCVWRYL